MRIAIPTTGACLEEHFGHCECFTLVDTDLEATAIQSLKCVKTPPHEPGTLPGWLKGQSVDLVIAGTMGERALGLLESLSIQVLTGAPAEPPDFLVRAYLQGKLSTQSPPCTHTHHCD